MSEELVMPTITEDAVSQLPALHVLQSLGYCYLPPVKALELRNGRTSGVLLEGILIPWLREHNRIAFRGRIEPFSEANILTAVQALRDLPFEGLIRTNEVIYDLLCLGKSLPQSIEGDVKSFPLHYIDWLHPERNVFHVTEEFAVTVTGGETTRRPDIVLFVNGIPFAVIECKAPNMKEPLKQAISQQLRNQREDEIPQLFAFSQILLALAKNEAAYATTGTARKFWSRWREEGDAFEKQVEQAIRMDLDEEEVDAIYAAKPLRVAEKPAEPYAVAQRQSTEQDRLLVALCRPERLLALTYRYLIFDAGVKKIARYQQYFCVEKAMTRLQTRDAEGRRQGGVVWHTQGSGKSLSMVLLAKAIALCADIKNPKIVLVTDRVDLDNQIARTFQHCGHPVAQAGNARELADLLSSHRQQIVTTVINKFTAAVDRYGARSDDDDIFVLVDEGHRTNYGSFHANMRRALPKACYLGFTGTPLMRKERSTMLQFGGPIDTYTIDRAVEDGAVVPLLYEGRDVDQEVDSMGIDAWFERITAPLSKKEAADLKRKFSTTDQLNKAARKVMCIAWDISEHFRDNWQGTGFKAQLVTQSKDTALLYRHFLNEFGMVSSEVLISGPDDREGEEELEGENQQEVQRFWKQMMARYGSEREYNKQLIHAFRNAEEPEIIIVVDKLLTGFDAPRNTVLYLTRKLREHALLQAIARVNRICEGKDFGYVLDYRGVLENLSHALDLYSALPEFDRQDIDSILTDISKAVAGLPQLHAALLDLFAPVAATGDEEAYERHLEPAERREAFYRRLSEFAKALAIALSSAEFLNKTGPQTVSRYRRDLAFFSKLRIVVRRRYAEAVDFGEYESRIQKLLDTHVGAGKIETITPLVNIFDQDAFSAEVERLPGAASMADTIAHRTARTIEDKMSEDPAFYKRFSQLLEETIAAFREQRIKANEYLKRSKEIMARVINRSGDSIPDVLTHHEVAKAYYGVAGEALRGITNRDDRDDLLADVALRIDAVIERDRIVNWIENEDVQNRMRTDIEDALFELGEERGITWDFDDLDELMEAALGIASVRRA